MERCSQEQLADPASEWWLECDQCGERLPLGAHLSGCPKFCHNSSGSVLETHFQPKKPPTPFRKRGAARGLLRYLDLLPGTKGREWIGLGEGGTPLLRSRVIGPRLGLNRLYFKNETVNPTWSFKDRYVAVTINMARSLGFRKFVVSSTGNLGVSVAAYSAAAGAECVFLAPPDTGQSLLNQARLYGARVVVSEDGCRRALLQRIAAHESWWPVSLFLPRAVQNPYGIEGYKSFAYELIEDLETAPAAALFPCARGNGLYGAWKGFRESLDWGWIERTPAMVACQPEGANSLEVSLRGDLDHVVELPRFRSVAVSTSETVASAHALRAIRESGGDALSASDPAIMEAVRWLGEEGLYVETSSALPVACLPRLLESRTIDPDESIVCVLTAAGIKWPHTPISGLEPVVELSEDPQAVERFCHEIGAA